MRLLTELIENAVKLEEEVIGEGDSAVKRHFLSGTFMQADVVNRNKRMYPLEVLENEVNRYIKEKVITNSAFGELNHPTGPSINGDRICMHIREINKEGSNFVGKALVASTPMGQIVKGLLSDGARLGVSSRALGSLKPGQDGVNEVQSDLKLCAIDCVTDPSGPECYVEGILEGKEWIYDPVSKSYVEESHILKQLKQDEVQEVVEQHKEELELKPAKVFDEAKQLLMFEQFLHTLVHNIQVKKETPKGPTKEELIQKFLKR